MVDSKVAGSDAGHSMDRPQVIEAPDAPNTDTAPSPEARGPHQVGSAHQRSPLGDTMARYRPPSERLKHRGFVYLDDETVINSLSAFEAGKVDEIVAKNVRVKGGQIGGGLDARVLKVTGDRSGSSSFEEEIVKTRTRFSLFNDWYETLRDRCIGTFDGWAEDILVDVRPGDTVELRGTVRLTAVETLLRLYLWFVDEAKRPESIFSRPQREHQQLKAGAAGVKSMLGSSKDPEIVFADVTPSGGPGPAVLMPLDRRWAIRPLGTLSGTYTIVGQIEEIVSDGDEYPTMRITSEVPVTKLEADTLKSAVGKFAEPAATFGLEIDESSASLNGPALILRPIAIFR